MTRVFRGRRTKVKAVDRLTLEVDHHELVVLVGPSGCGKTTTLRLVAGLDRPQQGTVHLGDRDVTRVPAHERNVAMVFENFALYPHLSVYSNIAFGLSARRITESAIAARISDVCERLRISDLLKRKPGQLSAGQKQRVALARALVRRPVAFLLDEPMGNLDAHLRLGTRAELRSLLTELQVPAIHVTHDQEEALCLADRIAVMHQGRLLQIDTPSAVYDQPATRFVATFFGSPPMNLVHARMTSSSGQTVVPLYGQHHLVPDRVVQNSRVADVVCGIRPEAVLLHSSEVPNQRTARIARIECRGAVRIVHLDRPDGQSLVAAVDRNLAIREGQPVTAQITSAAIHWFDADKTGNNLMIGKVEAQN